jgi:hypothetical protein
MKTYRHIALGLFFLALANFAAFVLVGLVIGGDALSGGVEDGHYYVSNHGIHAEVSHGTFIYSRIHTYSVFITHPLAFLAFFILLLLEKHHEPPAS